MATEERSKYLEPTFQKVWKEAIETENMIRMKWHAKYDPFIKRIGYGIQWEATSSDDEEESEDEIPLKEPRTVARPLPPVSALFPEPPPPAPPKMPWDIPEPSYTPMRPVSSAVRALIYDGISKEGNPGKGRFQYLLYRKKLGPEDKYYHPVCTSWLHGWTYGKPIELESPEHARVYKIKQTFYRRNGTQLVPRD